LDPWHAALTASGRDPAAYRVGIIRSCLVTDDAARDFAPIRAAERRRMALYQQFRGESGGHGGVAGITEEQRIPQGWIVGTLDECVVKMAAFIREFGLTDVVCWAVPPGIRPDAMQPHLERYARELVPRLKALFPG
jgi:alkanesulfonate monooxygenase SsuD/methylene tetrahydromethanopterin reductase-like flavin-dependent oxidoreductase (luciferase family)